MMTSSVFGRLVGSVDCCPWSASVGRHLPTVPVGAPRKSRHLYTEDERVRRDRSAWTRVQGVLAPLQFLVFLVSLWMVLRYLATGTGEHAATASIMVKVVVLYTIMITGSIWEHDVFGRYLFAPAFFWEDVVSMLVLALHTAYVAALLTGFLDVRQQMVLALAAYASYVVNATQFLLKLRAARREVADWPVPSPGALGLSR
jgi:3-vinyl bacteriochlorophyllide hydratase